MNRLLIGNIILWLVAMLFHPVSQNFPTGTGETPGIFSLLIPILFILFAAASTALLRKAATAGRGAG